MSDYDFRPAEQRGSNAMDYSRGTSSNVGVAIGLLVIAALIIAVFIGAGSGDGTDPVPADTTQGTAPAAPVAR